MYSYATSLNGLADEADLRLRFDVLTKTKQPELHRYWTTRDRAVTRRLFRLVAEVLRAIEAGVFHPVTGWHCKDCPFRSRCWAWGWTAAAGVPQRREVVVSGGWVRVASLISWGVGPLAPPARAWVSLRSALAGAA